MSWLENTSQINWLPDVAINSFSFIDCDALTNDITIIFYVCILDIIRNLFSTKKMGAMYPFKDKIVLNKINEIYNVLKLIFIIVAAFLIH